MFGSTGITITVEPDSGDEIEIGPLLVFIDRAVVLLRFLHVTLTFLLLLSSHVEKREGSIHLLLIWFFK